MFIPVQLEIGETDKGKGIFLKKDVAIGVPVLKIKKIALRPHLDASLNSIQVDDDLYVDTRDGRQQIWQFINHSCVPNTKLDLSAMVFTSLRKISRGEEVTYNYCTSEFDLASKNEAFACKCGSSSCIKTVQGFKHLNDDQKNKLRPLLIPYLLRKFILKKDAIEILPGKVKFPAQKIVDVGRHFET